VWLTTGSHLKVVSEGKAFEDGFTFFNFGRSHSWPRKEIHDLYVLRNDVGSVCRQVAQINAIPI
jgi:hypothetical protein